MDQPSKFTRGLQPGPLHTSQSIASKGAGVDSSSAGRSALRAAPLHTSGSAASQAAPMDSSSAGRSGLRPAPLQSGRSVAAQAALGNDPLAGKNAFWLGPEHAPESVAEVGVRQAILEDLTLKILYTYGPLSLRELVSYTRLPFSVVNELLRRMRAEQLCEIRGMTGNIPQIAITSQGRSRAAELLAVNQYTGPAPVSLENYKQQ